MEFGVKSGAVEQQKTACLVIGVFEAKQLTPTAEKVDKLSGGYISTLLERGDLTGKVGQHLMLFDLQSIQSQRVLLIGCGKAEHLDEVAYQKIISKMATVLDESGANEAVCHLTELAIKERDLSWKLQSAVRHTEQALYTFNEYKGSTPTPPSPLKQLYFALSTSDETAIAEKALLAGEAVAHGMNQCRRLADTPANFCRPKDLKAHAQSLAKQYDAVSLKALDRKSMEKLKMGLLLSVTAGSTSEPYLLSLTYNGAAKTDAPICFVGKGITFDTGGNSLKPPASMIGMKYDMTGAATVLGAFEAIAKLQLPVNVMAVVPTCENMPGPDATRPDDVITGMSGTTVEVLNTDAEGRLILADALTYCEQFKPAAVIDVATLTGSMVMAMGGVASGLFSNQKELQDELWQAGEDASDRCWPFPIWDEYLDGLKKGVADLTNIAHSPEAGAIVAACFLSQFTKYTHWAHLDIAGSGAVMKGPNRQATGRAVPLLVQFVLNRLSQTT